MKSVYEYRYDGTYLRLENHPNIRKNFPESRIVWNMMGMRGVIPPALLEAEFKLMDEYGSRLRDYDQMPPGVGLLSWDCVVRVPPHETPIGPPTDEDF